MKSALIAFVLLATSLFANAYPRHGGGGWDRPGRPTESFRETCNVIREDWSFIEADCRTIRGDYRYNNFDRRGCTSDIANINGRLQCGNSDNNPGQLPSGSYQRSCEQCYADSSVLQCQCEDTRGNFRSTSINYRRCSSDIANINGQLMCGR